MVNPFKMPIEGTQVRLLPDTQRLYNSVYMMYYNSVMMYCDIKPVQPKSVIKVVDESHVYKPAPFPKYSITARPVIGTILPDIPYSRHRSKRVLKKLRKRLSMRLYGDPIILTLKQEVIAKLYALQKRKRNPPDFRDMFEKYMFSLK